MGVERGKCKAICGLILGLVILASGCSSASSSGGQTPERAPSDEVASQDPQVFSDVVAGAFVTGSNQVRAIRISNAFSNLWREACGGAANSDLSSTDGRLNQARYADLDLIGEKGLAEIVDDPVGAAAEEVDLATCEQDVLPSAKEYHNLIEPWGEATRSAAESDAVSAVEPEVAVCLERESGLEVQVTDPTATYLSAADFQLSGAADWEAEMSRLSDVYVSCTGPYFEAMEAELQVAQDELVERNRELLERFAQEISAAGYVP